MKWPFKKKKKVKFANCVRCGTPLTDVVGCKCGLLIKSLNGSPVIVSHCDCGGEAVCRPGGDSSECNLCGKHHFATDSGIVFYGKAVNGRFVDS